ncbi:MAG TPA: PASTA domain-containing protein, partial [Glaciihabitans sp.]|nr:PASTA domain-containing protein [Glaciihabitans sp.]
PGSTYKVFTLINWLQNEHGINEVVNGSPRTIPQGQFTNSCTGRPSGAPYQFKNDSGESGPMTVATATQQSVNGAFISMALELDLCEIKQTAESIGVHRADGAELGDTPASVLGTNEIAPLSMATAYAAIAGQGMYCASIAVDRITGPDGAEMVGQPQNCTQQLEPDVANTAAFAMAKVMLPGGTATRANPNDGVEYIGKTGTTDASNHTWVIGASTRVATAVWVGNIEGFVPMRSYTSPTGAAGGVIRHDIFKPIATAIDRLPQYRGTDFAEPNGDLLTGSGVIVPGVNGRTVEEARSILEAAGFTVVDGGEEDGSAAAGTVARTSPSGGGVTSSGATITVYSSNGLLGTVPNSVGNGDVPGYAAEEQLQGLGFTNITTTCAVVPENQKDMVVAQTPSAGTAMRVTDPVTLTVGRESC